MKTSVLLVIFLIVTIAFADNYSEPLHTYYFDCVNLGREVKINDCMNKIDVIICDSFLISGPYSFEHEGYKGDHWASGCYDLYAVAHNEFPLCDRIHDNWWKYQCVVEYALMVDNQSICNLVPKGHYQINEYYCNSEFSSKTTDESISSIRQTWYLNWVKYKQPQIYIDHEKRNQKLYLSIRGDYSNDPEIWVIPLPANKENIAIQSSIDMPYFEGEDISNAARIMLHKGHGVQTLSQLYTIPLLMAGVNPGEPHEIFSFNWPNYKDARKKTDATYTVIEDPTFTYLSLDKSEINSAVVSEDELSDFVNNLGISAQNINKFYDDDTSSYVIIWQDSIERLTMDQINDSLSKLIWRITIDNPKLAFELITQKIVPMNYFPPSETIEFLNKNTDVRQEIVGLIYNNQGWLNNEEKTILIEFVTDNMFVPFLTSDSQINRIKPKIYRIKGLHTINGGKVEYYESIKLNSFLAGQLNKNIDIDYTLVEGDSKLKVKKTPPIKVIFTLILLKIGVVFLLFIFIINSIASSLLAGIIMFQSFKKEDLIKFGLIGLSNLGSIILVGFVSLHYTKKMVGKSVRNYLFIPVFSFLFMIISYVSILFLGFLV